LFQLFDCFWLWLFFKRRQKVAESGLERWVVVDFDQAGLESEVQKERLFLFDIFHDDGFFEFEIERLKVFYLISPEADFYSFELVSDDDSDNISLIVSCVLFIRSFFFNLVNDTNYVYIFVFAKVGIMVPVEKFFGILVVNLLICNFMDLILLIFKPDLGRK
jgi:hypothetical protein